MKESGTVEPLEVLVGSQHKSDILRSTLGRQRIDHANMMSESSFPMFSESPHDLFYGTVENESKTDIISPWKCF